MSIIAAVLMFGLIVLIHEFGHFLFAKLNGIGVLEFSIGMGPRLLSFKPGETRYSIKLLPFGGSCMMEGEDDENVSPTAFQSKPVWGRISVVLAGPVFNFLLALGMSMALIGAEGYSQALITEVVQESPAEQAGVEPGMEIVRVNGRRVHSYQDLTLYMLTHPGQALELTGYVSGWGSEPTEKTVTVTPQYDSEQGVYLIGVFFDGTQLQVKSPVGLLAQGIYQMEYWTHYVLDSFSMMFHGLVGLNDLSGPVGIVTVIGTTVEEASPYGIGVVLIMLANFCIMLSVTLGIMNLLPIPGLDGGRLVFLLLEAVRGKPVNPKREGMVHLTGMALLMVLMIFILFNDIRKLF